MTPEQAKRLAALLKRTALEDRLAVQIAARGLPLPVRQLRFHPTRKWLFDFAWPQRKLAVEVDGGEWVRGNHWRPEGVARDREKAVAADRLGWTVLHFTGSAVRSGAALAKLTEALSGNGVGAE